jgi:membrane-bound serine protease (ClpP class)
VVEDFEQVKSFYQLDSYPTTLRPSATDRWVERVAMFLSSPPVSMFLLFMGMFFFSSEMSAPGLGVPGFMATVCFILFFWSQYLGGNAHWLEIILFLAGIVFVAMEIFVLPGFGIFGIGGLLMIVVSLVLASQDFIIPRTSAELARLPLSLLPVVGAGLGFFTAIFALRKLLPNSPYLKNMLLSPRNNQDETGLQSDHDPEAIVDWSYLLGSTGETITRLFPAGKARISGKVYDVITDGRMVDKGQKVEVIEAVGNRVVVVPSE